jgi:gamma-glutamylcyclotransferase (GGCT)/AIG2-like uncharacterized protein YtfP
VNTIFVYGLLKPGLSLHHLIEPYVTRSLEGTARGRLYAAEYPAARFEDDGEIDGVVMWLDEARIDEALGLLDEAEDEGVVYERRTIAVATPEGTVRAHAYHWLLSIDGCDDVGRSWPAG